MNADRAHESPELELTFCHRPFPQRLLLEKDRQGVTRRHCGAAEDYFVFGLALETPVISGLPLSRSSLQAKGRG
jgi:hypothetical protein